MATHSSILAWKNPTDKGALWATVHGAAESWTQLSNSAYKWGIIKLQNFCPRSEGPEPHKRLASPGFLHHEDEPPEHLAFKASEAYVGDTSRVVRKRLHS